MLTWSPPETEMTREDSDCPSYRVPDVTAGNQAEEGAGEPAEAALGAGEAGGGEEADGRPPAQGGAGVRGKPLALSDSHGVSPEPEGVWPVWSSCWSCGPEAACSPSLGVS